MPSHHTNGGGAVEPGFRLPWNTTVTLADRWSEIENKSPTYRGGVKPKKVRTPAESKELPPARMGRPPSSNYRLHDWQGSFLHESCIGMTKDERVAWKGNAKQLAAVRSQFPNTVDLIASEVA